MILVMEMNAISSVFSMVPHTLKAANRAEKLPLFSRSFSLHVNDPIHLLGLIHTDRHRLQSDYVKVFTFVAVTVCMVWVTVNKSLLHFGKKN